MEEGVCMLCTNVIIHTGYNIKEEVGKQGFFSWYNTSLTLYAPYIKPLSSPTATGIDYPYPEDPSYVRGHNHPSTMMCFPLDE